MTATMTATIYCLARTSIQSLNISILLSFRNIHAKQQQKNYHSEEKKNEQQKQNNNYYKNIESISFGCSETYLKSTKSPLHLAMFFNVSFVASDIR